MNNYKGKIKTLEKYALTKGLTFKYKKNKDFFITKKHIFVGTKLKKEKKIFSILHELGHNLDDLKKDKSKEKIYHSVVKKMNKNKKIGGCEYSIFLDCEKKAWETGFKIARELNIELSTYNYYLYAQKCLDSYSYNKIKK